MRQLAKVEQVSYCAHQICSSGQHLLGCLYPEAVIFIDLFSLLFCLFLVVCLFAHIFSMLVSWFGSLPGRQVDRLLFGLLSGRNGTAALGLRKLQRKITTFRL